ncbi:MAG: chorismate synthase [Clostridia bacterium]|nr:chorismate synthase [Clostridia bacterium]
MASVYGTKLKLSVFGESHGKAIGVTIDGFPAGLPVDTDYIAAFMKRRAPGGAFSTKRTEADIPNIISGVSNGFTNGYPICAVIENTNQHSASYADKMTIPRPNHADYAASVKYGEHVELHGGGHFSGRLTAPLVFAGALCSLWLRRDGIEIAAHIKQILNVTDSPFPGDVTAAQLAALRERDFPAIDNMAKEAFATIINSAQNKGDSVGAKIECAAAGLPVAIGEHMFGSVESEISQLMFAVPAVKGIEFGAGFDFCRMYGSQANDTYTYRDGKVVTRTNNCGGITGGMTNGMPVIFSVAMKPTPSIYLEQDSVNLETQTDAKLAIKGRHDPCIAVRAVPVIEACTAIALTGLMLNADGRKL